MATSLLRGDGRIRTGAWSFCRALPYHLATSPHQQQVTGDKWRVTRPPSRFTLCERVMGFEPTTFSLARRRSTAEPHPHVPIRRAQSVCLTRAVLYPKTTAVSSARLASPQIFISTRVNGVRRQAGMYDTDTEGSEPELTLDLLLAQVTDENRHDE